jgi:outer membrane lipoprotein-sorting protein
MRLSYRYVSVAAVLAAWLLMPGAARAQDENARALLDKVEASIPHIPLMGKATLTSPSRGWAREMTLMYKRIGDVDASYMEVTSPLDVKDTRFLLLDHEHGADEQFIYVPAIKRSIQVSEQTRKQPFLGSDFYVSDMVRPDLDGYTYRFVGEEDVLGRHCKLIESTPKDPAKEPYSKSIIAVDPKDLVIVRTQFFDAKGKLLKVWTIEKLEKIDGYWTPMVQVMKNVQDGTESKLTLTEIKYNADIPDETFRRAYLIR